MNLIFLIFFISSNQGFSQEHDHEHAPTTEAEYYTAPCKVPIAPLTYPEIENLKKHMEWFGALKPEIANAPCKTKTAPTSSDMLELIAQKSAGKHQNAQVNGVIFKDESPQLIQAFKDFTTAKDFYGFYAAPKDQTEFQKQFAINPECTKVMCAMEKIWGKSMAEKLLYIRLKHNFNASEYAFDSSARYEESELEDVVMALDDLPPHVIPLGKPNQKLSMFERGQTLAIYANTNVAANASVVFFGNWSKAPRLERQYMAYHEFSHNMSDHFKDMDVSPKWIKLSNWVKKGDNWTRDDKVGCYTSKYGLTNPYEDFAEAAAAYRFGPKNFKKNCPEKYAFIKAEVYKGIEYDSVEACAPISKKGMEVVDAELKEAQQAILNAKVESPAVLELCKTELIYEASPEQSSDCYSKILTQSLKSIDPEKISAAMKKAGIKKTDVNTELLLARYTESTLKNDELAPLLSAQALNIKSLMNEQIDQIAKQAMPLKPRLHYNFEKTCVLEIWNRSTSGMKECAARQIVEDDKRYRKWGAGNAFPKLNLDENISETSRKSIEERRDQIFIEEMKTGNLLDEQIQTTQKAIKNNMTYHFQISENNIRKSTLDWKTMNPKEFCATFYAKPSFIIVNYLPSDMSEIPNMNQWCEARQSASKKRFVFSSKEIEKWPEP